MKNLYSMCKYCQHQADEDCPESSEVERTEGTFTDPIHGIINSATCIKCPEYQRSLEDKARAQSVEQGANYLKEPEVRI